MLIEDLQALAVKLRNSPLDSELVFNAIEEINKLQTECNDLKRENYDLRRDGRKTQYERQREIEDEIYYRQHGNLGYK